MRNVYRIWSGSAWIPALCKVFQSGGWVPVVGGGVPQSLPPQPTVRTGIVARLDPANYPGRVFTVGVDHATINGCLALADAASSPTAWSLVMIPPGTYNEYIARPANGLGKRTDIRSTTLNPDDVIVQPSGTTANTFEHNGTGGIIAGITFVSGGSMASIHSGVFGSTDYDFIYYRVKARRVSGARDAFSWGVGPGQHVYAYDCSFTGYGSEQSTYFHNFPGPQPTPASLVFDNVNTGNGVHALEEDSGQDDRLYIKGGSGSIGLGQLDGVNTFSWSGAVDPVLAFTAINPHIGRVLPYFLPVPARISGWF